MPEPLDPWQLSRIKAGGVIYLGTPGELLKVNGISKRFYGVAALSGISFELRDSEVLAIVGENGAGKSTMIKILAGALAYDEGTIQLNGQEFSPKDPRAATEAGISVIYQDLHLIPQLSVAANVYLNDIPNRKHAGIGFVRQKELISKTKELFNKLGFEIDPKIQAGKLSRAVRQQVEIAKALATKAKIIIMDEPTASLEAKEVEKLFDIIRQLKAGGTSVIFVSHRLDEILEIADRITVFRDGQVVGTKKRSELNGNQLVQMIVGREIESMFTRERDEPREEIFSAKAIKAGAILEPISFNVKQGEILGFTGLIGSGYADVLKVISGQEPVTEGKIIVENTERKVRRPHDAIKHGLGYVPEDRKNEGLFTNLSVEKNIVIASLEKVSSWGFISRKKCRKLVEPLMESLKIKAANSSAIVKTLSGGNQQKVIIARWLASNARLLALIEPTHGIDIGAKVEVYKLLNDFARNRGAVLFSSSELPEVIGVSDRIIAFRKGTIVAEMSAVTTTQSYLLDKIFGHYSYQENEQRMDVGL